MFQKLQYYCLLGNQRTESNRQTEKSTRGKEPHSICTEANFARKRMGIIVLNAGTWTATKQTLQGLVDIILV